MRKITWFLTVIVLVILIGFLSPLVTGIYFSQEYAKFIHSYNQNDNVILTLKNYHRGWFSSDAVLEISLKPSPFAKSLNLSTISTPFIAYQHIQHGPIFFHDIGFNTFFGLATIVDRWEIPENIKNSLKQVGLVRFPDTKESSMMTLTGRFITYFKIGDIEIANPPARIFIHGLVGKGSVDADVKNVQGIFTLSALSVVTPENTSMISDITLDFDQHKILQNLWVGKNSLEIAHINFKDKDGLVNLNDIHFDGQTSEEKGLLDAFSAFNIANLSEEMKGDTQSMGPLHFKLSIHKVSAQAINDLLTAYRETTERGELYALQLQQKLMNIAPFLINTESSIVLDELSLKTKDGDLQLTAKAYWPNKNSDQLFAIIQATEVETNLHIAKKLVERLIQFTAEPAFVKKPVDPENLPGAPGTPPIPSAISIKAGMSPSPIIPAPIIPAKTPETIPEKIHEQITEWLNAGYIKQDADNYTVNIQRHNGQLTVNGKPI